MKILLYLMEMQKLWVTSFFFCFFFIWTNGPEKKQLRKEKRVKEIKSSMERNLRGMGFVEGRDRKKIRSNTSLATNHLLFQN